MTARQSWSPWGRTSKTELAGRRSVQLPPKLTTEADCGPTRTELPACNDIEDWAGTEPLACETNTLPLALWALAVGMVAGRRQGSWVRLGAGLVVALGPSALLAVADPSPVRSVVVVLAGAALVAVPAQAQPEQLWPRPSLSQ